jgi:hypothetical protein
MKALSELEIIKKFRESIAKGAFDQDIKVTYVVSGGMPSERLEEELVLSGSGEAKVKYADRIKLTAPQEAFTSLDLTETRLVFEKVASSLDNLIPRSKARFLPDSMVGSITIEVDGKQTTLFFPVEEVSIETKDDGIMKEAKNTSPMVVEMVRYFKETSKQLLTEAQEGRK